jgi:hypothetical protein
MSATAQGRAPAAGRIDGERTERVARAVRRWTEQLIDTGARNNLLHYRDLRRGTLSLDEADAGTLDRLLAGGRVRLSRLFPAAGALADAGRRAQTLHARALEHEEERGVRTLHLACGLATWTPAQGASRPHAPVLLRPLTLIPTTAAHDDFDLRLDGDMAVSPTLLYVLRTQFSAELDLAPLEERREGEIDTRAGLREAYDWLLAGADGRVPGLAVEPRLVVGTFAYAKLPMVQDLERSLERLAAHDLVAAIAGDPGAQEAVRARGELAEVPIDLPDRTPPRDEFLVLDADASQSQAINAVLAGADLIVRGPPGTGKSQTIANLVAALVARGKSVLFVAEKRAAIDAVMVRLERAGLADLAFDLHSETTSRRRLAERLADALRSVRSVPLVDREPELARLEAARSALLERARALHRPREPWGVSLFDAAAELLGLGAAAAGAPRLAGEALARLDAAAVETAASRLARYAALGGPGLATSGRPWAAARVKTAAEAREAHELVADLRASALPRARARLELAAAATGLPAASTAAGWAEPLALWGEAAGTLALLRPEAFDADLDELLEALAPAARGGLAPTLAALTSSAFRRARSRGPI